MLVLIWRDKERSSKYQYNSILLYVNYARDDSNHIIVWENGICQSVCMIRVAKQAEYQTKFDPKLSPIPNQARSQNKSDINLMSYFVDRNKEWIVELALGVSHWPEFPYECSVLVKHLNAVIILESIFCKHFFLPICNESVASWQRSE